MNRDIAIMREAIVKLTQLLAGKGLVVTQRGTQAYVKTDAKTLKPTLVNIPAIPDTASIDLILAIQGFIDHEVAHVLFTDWSFVKKAQAGGEKMRQLHNLFEDTFIERAMAGKFPGSAYNIKLLHEFFIEKITKPALSAASDDAQRFGVLLVPVIRAWSGQTAFKNYLDKTKGWESPGMAALLKKVPQSLIDRIPKMKDSGDAYRLAAELHDIIFPPASAAPPPPTPAPSDDESGNGADKSDDPSPGKTSADQGKGEKDHTEKPEPDDEEEEASSSEGGLDPEENEDEEEGDEAEPEDGESGAEGSGSDEGEDFSEDENDTDDTDDDPFGDDPSSAGEENDDDDLPSEGEDREDEDSDGEDSDGEGEESDEDQKGSGSDGDEGDGEESQDEDGSEGKSGSASGDNGESGEGSGSEDGEGETNASSSDKPGMDMGGFGEVDLSGVDLSSMITGMIGTEAARATRSAPYTFYTKDLDKIEVYPHSNVADEYVVKLEEETRHMVGVMQKDIERMMAARSQSVRVPGYRSGRLHSAGLHRILAGDDRVFRRKTENNSKDTAVSLVVDNSGSMSGMKMKLAMEAAYALSQTLERVGIAHECIGFTTRSVYGRDAVIDPNSIKAEARRIGLRSGFSRIEPIYMPIFKTFDERLTPLVKRRFVHAATHQGYLQNNIDGESVENAVKRVMSRRETRKVVIVLSDGQPACYTEDPGAVFSHLHSVIDEAAKAKIEIVGIGIMDDAVKSFYPKYMVLKRVEDLPAAVMGELRRILGT